MTRSRSALCCPRYVCISAAYLKCLKNSVRMDRGLQLILYFVFHRKCLPQTLESYIKVLQIDRYCVKTETERNRAKRNPSIPSSSQPLRLPCYSLPLCQSHSPRLFFNLHNCRFNKQPFSLLLNAN